MLKRVCLQIFSNSFNPEIRGRRSLKAAEVTELFDTCIGEALLTKSNLPAFELLSERIFIKRRDYPKLIRGILTRLGLLHLLRYLQLRLAYKYTDISLIHCHDYDTLPIAYRLAKNFECPFVYDAHELEEGRANITPRTRKIVRRILKKYLPAVDALVTVSSSIEEWFLEHYPISKSIVVRSIPDTDSRVIKDEIIRNDLGLPDDVIIFGYVGHLLKDRSLLELIEVFERINDHQRVFVIMGGGALRDKIESIAQKSEVVYYHPPVPVDEVVRYTSGFDVGINIYDPAPLSRRYALPNKFFQYIHAGVPIMSNDTEEPVKYNNRYGLGWSVPYDFNKIEKTVKGLSLNEIERHRNNVLKTQNVFTWQKESQKYIDLYKELMKK